MRKSSRIALKIFLEQDQELGKFLPEKMRLELAETQMPAKSDIDPFAGMELIDQVHWSWFLPTLRTYSETEQRLFLSSLDMTARRNLSKSLELTAGQATPPTFARHYLREVLLDSLIDRQDPPFRSDCLPTGHLTHLLTLSKKELVQLINALSLHDLAEELRQIVETKVLKKIYSFLSEKEKRLLKAATAHKDPFSFGRLGLEKWDGSEENFRHLLHRRGLMRLSVAISGEEHDFIWHLCHQLDIGRGTVLFRLCRKEASHTIRGTVQAQVEELL